MGSPLSFWPTVPNNWYASKLTVAETHRGASLVLTTTRQAQVIHVHPHGAPCVRGGCYLLEWAHGE